MISAFNNGITYHRGNIKYPIRDDVYNGKLSCQDVLEIINRLKTSYDSYETIAKDYDVDYRTIAKINKGTSHYQSNEEYPIRESKPCGATPKFTFDQITQITNLLLNTKISLREIGRMFNASYDDIVNIKNGKLKMYRRKGLTYPLRKIIKFLKPVSTILAKRSTTAIDTPSERVVSGCIWQSLKK